MRSRELLANWLICIVKNSEVGAERLTFTSDPTGGDGIIYDTETEDPWLTEHVMVPREREGETSDSKALILKAIKHKQTRAAAAYASGKTLGALCLDHLPDHCAGVSARGSCLTKPSRASASAMRAGECNA